MAVDVNGESAVAESVVGGTGLRPGPAGGRRVLVLVLALAALAGLTVGGLAALGVFAPAAGPWVLHDYPVTAMDIVTKPSNNSPSLAVDPTQPRFVVEANRQDAPYGCALELSGDGGAGWVGGRMPPLPAGADSCYAPQVAFDRTGRLYLLFVGLHGRGHSPMGVFLASSTDRARTFSRPVRILGPERYQATMAIDGLFGARGRIYVTWLDAGAPQPMGGFAPSPNPIMLAHSDDGGQTFSRPVQVSDPDRIRSVAPALAVGPDHAVHVVYYDLGVDARDYQGLVGPAYDGKWSLISSTSRDGGATFSKGMVVDDSIVPPGRVMLIYTMAPASLAVGPEGTVYVGWHDARNGDWDVFLRRSTDGGRSFKALQRLNDDPLHDGIDQYLPKLSVASNGRVDAIFYDRRSDPNNHYNDVYYTYSTDQGAHWSRNRKLTVWFSDPDLGPQYTVVSAKGMFDIGSRLALVSSPSRALAAWTDTRNEQRGKGAQDIFATEVRFPGASSPAASAGAAGLPSAPPTVGVVMKEFTIQRPASIPGGRVIFRVHNAGRLQHVLQIVVWPDSLPPLDVVLHGHRAVTVNELGGTPLQAPGETDEFAVDLAPGRYAMVDLLLRPDGQLDARKGMATEFQIPRHSTTSPPTATTTVYR